MALPARSVKRPRIHMPGAHPRRVEDYGRCPQIGHPLRPALLENEPGLEPGALKEALIRRLHRNGEGRLHPDHHNGAGELT
jgi:hypothetical protein